MWQVFCQDTITQEVGQSCFGKNGDITYLDWMMSAWGWTVSVSLLSLVIALVLGTIIGMIDIFASQGVSGANPAQLAQGISIALYTTGLGLIIAIPAMIFWRHFRALIDSFVIDMEQQAIKLVEVAHGERRA